MDENLPVCNATISHIQSLPACTALLLLSGVYMLHLQEISASLLAILQPLAAPGSPAGPQSREQAARIVTFLTPLAVAPAPNTEAGEALAVQTAFGAKLLPNPNWPLNEGYDLFTT